MSVRRAEITVILHQPFVLTLKDHTDVNVLRVTKEKVVFALISMSVTAEWLDVIVWQCASIEWDHVDVNVWLDTLAMELLASRSKKNRSLIKLPALTNGLASANLKRNSVRSTRKKFHSVELVFQDIIQSMVPANLFKFLVCVLRRMIVISMQNVLIFIRILISVAALMDLSEME